MPEPEPEFLGHRRARIGGQVPAGDAEIELAGPDIDGDVLGAQEEELDVVGRVQHGQITGIVPLPVTGLAEHVGGGLAQRALVRDGNSQHGGDPLDWFGRRVELTWVSHDDMVAVDGAAVVCRQGPDNRPYRCL